MEKFNIWHQSFLSELDCLGSYFEEDDIPYNIVDIDYNQIKKWEKDIYRLLELSRVLSFENINKRRDLTPEHKFIFEQFKNKIILPPIARPDTILIDKQPKIIEFNYDSSAIEGLYEIDYLQSKILANPELDNSKFDYFKSGNQIANFINKIFKKYVNSSESDKKMAILIYSDMNRYDKDVAEITSNWINKNTDIQCFVRMHEMLWNNKGIITDGKNEFQLLYMYSTLIDTPSKTRNLEKLILETANTSTLIISDPKDVVVDCKSSLYMLQDYANGQDNFCSLEDSTLISDYIPWSSEILLNKKVKYKGNDFDLVELLINNQNDFVIKKTYSFYAKNILLGSKMTKAEWKNNISYILNAKKEVWIAQEFLNSDLFDFKYYNSHKKEFYSLTRHFVISPYFFGDTIVNFLIRVEKNKDSRVLGRHTDGNMGIAFVGWK